MVYGVVLLINIIALSVLGAVIYFKDRKNVFNQVFSFSLFWLVVWMVSHFARYTIIPFRLIVTKEQFFYWAKISHYTGIYTTAFVSYFLMVFPERRDKPFAWWFTALWLGVIPAGVVVLNYFGLIIKDMHQIGMEYFIVAGAFQPLYSFLCVAQMFSGAVVIIRKIPRLAGLQRMQAKYVGAGFVVSAVFIIATNLLLPTLTMVFPQLLRFSVIYRFAPFYTLLFFFCAAYAIMKHRLLDIELVVSQSVAYLIATTTVIGGYILIVAFTEQFVRGIVGYSGFTVASVSALVVAFIFHPLKSAVHNLIYNKLFAQRFSYQKFLLEASQTIVTILNLEELINYIVDTVRSHIGTARVSFLLRNEEDAENSYYYIHTYRGVPPEIANNFKITNGLIDWFKKTRQVFFRDEAEIEMAAKGFSKLFKKLQQIGAEALVPIFTKDKLVGILAMDRKDNGRIYSKTDIDILNILAAQVGVAIDNARLYGEASTDSLTGLFNRRYFDYRFREEVQRAQRYKRSVSLFMMDIDNFKSVNEQYGHLAGDFVLKHIAKIVRENMRKVDIACRYRGEEIAFILPETDKENKLVQDGEVKTIEACKTAAERIRKQIQEYTFSFADKKINVTVSIGMCYYSAAEGQQTETQTILELADKALSQAKQEHGNCVKVLGWI